ncbi:hypothetical protein TNCV_4602331 [Trichonephila clavipes]|nr:hypothetical protein TNCV_4602331 [Trichonephila clavipes]
MVWHLMKKCLNIWKIAILWVPHQLTEVRKWHQYSLASRHLKRYRYEGDTLLPSILVIDETLVVMSPIILLSYCDGGSGTSSYTLPTHLT